VKQILTFGSLALLFMAATINLNAKHNDSHKRLDQAAVVLTEIMNTTDTNIPRELLEKARCAVVIPGMKKAAFIVGGKFGRGFVTCRTGNNWSSPAAVRMEGGSVGFQIGGSEVDLVMLVMNDEGAKKLLESQFVLGGETVVAAGPVGRASMAQTDGKLSAGILAWSRARGAFAGISLQGATLRQDDDGNEELYGKKVSNIAIVSEGAVTLTGGSKLQTLLQGYNPAGR
jgi:SH3 domain-containing YSC84-like protein 1